MEKYSKVQTISKQVGERNDCSVKAVALACDVPYRVAHKALENQGRKEGRGVLMGQIKDAITSLGYTAAPAAYTAKTAITLERDKLLAKGHYIAMMNGHVAAVVNGQVQDWTNGRRHHIVQVWLVVPTESRKARAKLAKQVFKN